MIRHLAAALVACVLFPAMALAASEQPQETQEEKLLARLAKATSTREKVDIYCDLSRTVSYENATRAIQYGQKAVELAIPEKYLLGWVIGLSQQAVGQSYSGNHAEASRLCQEAIERATAGKEFPGLVRAYQIAGICCREQADFQGALDYYGRALDVVRTHDIQDKKTLLTLYGNMAGVYAVLEQWGNAVQYYHKADELIEDDPHYKLVALANLTYTYTNMRDFANSDLYAGKLLALAERNNNRSFVASAHAMLGERYLLEFETDARPALLAKARGHLLEAVAVLAKYDRNTSFVDTALNLGRTLIEQKNYQEAIPYLRDALATSERNKLTLSEARAHGLLSRAYKGLGQADLALVHLEKDKELSRRIYKENLDQKVSRMMVRFDTLNKEHELERTRIKNESLEKDAVIHRYAIVIVSVLSLLLLVVIVLLAVLYVNKRRVAQILDTLSRTDPLTGLLNRRAMNEALREAVVRHDRSGAGFCVLLSDIDHFKKFNDTYGHDCGDAVLRRIAETLRGALRENDRLCRWGGEEFLVLLPDADLHDGALVAEKLRGAVAGTPLEWRDERLTVTMSFGVAESRAAGDVDRTIRTADDALYSAKEKGRNCVVAGEPPAAASSPAA